MSVVGAAAYALQAYYLAFVLLFAPGLAAGLLAFRLSAHVRWFFAGLVGAIAGAVLGAVLMDRWFFTDPRVVASTWEAAILTWASGNVVAYGAAAGARVLAARS